MIDQIEYKEYPVEAMTLLEDFARIPAPSGKEDKRVAFCLDWLQKNGVQGAFQDEAKNLIIPFGDSGQNPLVVFSAHSDLVFPDETPLPYRDDGELIHCPGIADNSVHVVALLWAAKLLSSGIIRKKGRGFSESNPSISGKKSPETGKPAEGLLLVINSCEEGLGNLKGSRHLLETYGKRVKAFIAFDSIYEEIVTIPIGSMRYRIHVTTQGGHSFRDFGQKNAIAILSDIVHDLYQLQVPAAGKTTFNVGTIQGGTSVNTIAQSAEMLFEFRSDDRNSLSFMHQQLQEILEKHRSHAPAGLEPKNLSEAVNISCDLIGQRPCMGDVDPAARDSLVALAEKLLRRHYPEEPVFSYGSTDCNIPLSLGIPAVCLGCCRGHGAHTREEYLRKDSLAPGLNLAIDFILSI